MSLQPDAPPQAAVVGPSPARRSFLESVAALAGGTAIAQGILLLASPLITRLYTPTSAGVFAAYASLLGILSVISSGRYELAIPIAADEDMALDLLGLALGINSLFALLVGLLGWSLAGVISRHTALGALTPFFWLLAFALFLQGSFEALNYWAVRRRAYRQIAQAKVAQSIGHVAVQAGLGMTRYRYAGLLIGDTVGRGVLSGLLQALLAGTWRSVARKVSFNGMWLAAVRYRKFPLIQASSALLNNAALSMPPLLAAAFYGPEVAGLLLIGQRVAGVPTALVGQAVSQVYFGELARLARDSPQALRSFLFRVAGRLTLLAIAPAAVLLLAGPQIIAIVFGSAWRPAGVLLQVVVPMYLVQFVVSPVSQGLMVLERLDIQFAWDLARLIGVLICFAAGRKYGLAATTTFGAYSATMVLAYCGLFLINARLLGRPTRGAVSA